MNATLGPGITLCTSKEARPQGTGILHRCSEERYWRSNTSKPFTATEWSPSRVSGNLHVRNPAGQMFWEGEAGRRDISSSALVALFDQGCCSLLTCGEKRRIQEAGNVAWLLRCSTWHLHRGRRQLELLCLSRCPTASTALGERWSETRTSPGGRGKEAARVCGAASSALCTLPGRDSLGVSGNNASRVRRSLAPRVSSEHRCGGLSHPGRHQRGAGSREEFRWGRSIPVQAWEETPESEAGACRPAPAVPPLAAPPASPPGSAAPGSQRGPAGSAA